MNEEPMLVLADHNHFGPARPEEMNMIGTLIWRLIGRKAGARFFS
jgi:hypothetical protein